MRPFYWILIAGLVVTVACGALALAALGSDADPAAAAAAHQHWYRWMTRGITAWVAGLLVAAALDRRVAAWTLAVPILVLAAARMLAALVVSDPWMAFVKTHGLWQGGFDGTLLALLFVYLPACALATAAALAVRRWRERDATA